jgi:mannonate dehydratase
MARHGKDTDHALEDVARHKEMGFKAVRVQSGIPGLATTYGISKGPGDMSRPSAGCHRSTSGRPSFTCATFPSCLRGCARSLAMSCTCCTTATTGLTPIEAGRLGKELEPFHLFWMEDPTPAELQEGFKIIREHTTTPIAVGEVFNSIWDAHDLIRNQWIDYLRMTLVHGGGFTHLKKAADFAALYHVRTGFHGATDLSPVTMAAALHFDTAIHNFGIQELMPHSDETDAVFPHHYTLQGWNDVPGDAPGWAWTWTRRWRQNILISGPICPSTASWTAR